MRILKGTVRRASACILRSDREYQPYEILFKKIFNCNAIQDLILLDRPPALQISTVLEIVTYLMDVEGKVSRFFKNWKFVFSTFNGLNNLD
jgi:hypothetical protein